MYAHATTYPSLRTRRPRRARAARRPAFFLRRTTQHVRVCSRRRARTVSWTAEILRAGAALAGVAAWTAIAYLIR
jgi:hypothetical protein